MYEKRSASGLLPWFHTTCFFKQMLLNVYSLPCFVWNAKREMYVVVYFNVVSVHAVVSSNAVVSFKPLCPLMPLAPLMLLCHLMPLSPQIPLSTLMLSTLILTALFIKLKADNV